MVWMCTAQGQKEHTQEREVIERKWIGYFYVCCCFFLFFLWWLFVLFVHYHIWRAMRQKENGTKNLFTRKFKYWIQAEFKCHSFKNFRTCFHRQWQWQSQLIQKLILNTSALFCQRYSNISKSKTIWCLWFWFSIPVH